MKANLELNLSYFITGIVIGIFVAALLLFAGDNMNKDIIIYEMPVFDGRAKEWRVLNLLTGTVYSESYDSESAALADINEGEKRGQATREGGFYIVRKIRRLDLLDKIQ